MILLFSGGITAEVRTKGDRGHEAGTGRRRLGLVQVQGPNIIITAEVVVKAGWLEKKKKSNLGISNVQTHTFADKQFVCCNLFICSIIRERKKKSEKVRRKSRSRSASPPAFRGRNTAMDAQEALARRQEIN